MVRDDVFSGFGKGPGASQNFRLLLAITKANARLESPPQDSHFIIIVNTA